ncbi:MAG: hypothetical protein EPO68_00125 [Planctomycetota bacterium]|nr:MAG: hypothetical protein EPO68_00125 [Planctomycetota bacterium]
MNRLAGPRFASVAMLGFGLALLAFARSPSAQGAIRVGEAIEFLFPRPDESEVLPSGARFIATNTTVGPADLRAPGAKGLSLLVENDPLVGVRRIVDVQLDRAGRPTVVKRFDMANALESTTSFSYGETGEILLRVAEFPGELPATWRVVLDGGKRIGFESIRSDGSKAELKLSLGYAAGGFLGTFARSSELGDIVAATIVEDGDGRVVELVARDAAGVQCALAQAAYHASGRLSRLEFLNESAKRVVREDFVRNERGELLSIESRVAGDPRSTSVRTFSRLAGGGLRVSQTHEVGTGDVERLQVRHVRCFSNAGLLVSEWSYDGVDLSEIVFDYEFDARGNWTRQIRNGFVTRLGASKSDDRATTGTGERSGAGVVVRTIRYE